MKTICQACGAVHVNGMTCQDDFYQLLYWENEFPELGIVHNLMVLCYYLQHPHLYSAAGLKEGRRLLDDFLLRGLTPEKVRQDNRERLDSKNRKFKIKSTTGDQGRYAVPPTWTMTAADVVAAGPEHYDEQVRAWAKSIVKGLNDIPSTGAGPLGSAARGK